MIRRLAPLAVAALILIVPACGGTSEEPAGTPQTEAAAPDAPAAPADVLQSFYKHLNEKDYDAALALYSAEARKVVDDPGMMGPDAFRAWAYEETKGGTISNVAIQGTTENTVDYTLTFADGSTVSKKVSAVQEDGTWKLGMVQ